MKQPIRMFQAADAVAYVDSYRRHTLEQPPSITAIKEKMEQQMDGMELVPPRTWAEYRGIEHALAFRLKREEPGLVVLGSSEGILDKEGKILPTGAASPELKQLREDKQRLEDEIDRQKREVKALLDHQHDMEVDLINARQRASRLEKKLEQSYAYFAVVGGTGLLLIVTMMGIFVFR